MSEITLDHWFLVGVALFTAQIWTPCVIEITKWHREPATLKKAVLLFVLIPLPLLLYGLGMELRGVMDIIPWL